MFHRLFRLSPEIERPVGSHNRQTFTLSGKFKDCSSTFGFAASHPTGKALNAAFCSSVSVGVAFFASALPMVSLIGA